MFPFDSNDIVSKVNILVWQYLDLSVSETNYNTIVVKLNELKKFHLMT